jgi:beta-1,4-mannosyl-glycoprotein beta-1,4-N-acetylglucosaminyltransferase
MKWFDSFMFNGEPVIKLRLEYLFNKVDVFYICEQRYTHQGTRKDILFFEKHSEWFAPYISKIVLLIDENNYEGGSWAKENAHRNYPISYISENHKGQQYILSVCDCDEIPDVDAVTNKKDLYEMCNNGAVYMKQKLFYYNLNWYISDWSRAYFLNDTSFQSVPNFQLFRDGSGPTSGSFECGWHLSYFNDKDGIIRKLNSFAHSEFNNSNYKDPLHVYKCIKEGIFLFNLTSDKKMSHHGNTVQITKYTGSFPPPFYSFNEYILKLQE